MSVAVLFALSKCGDSKKALHTSLGAVAKLVKYGPHADGRHSWATAPQQSGPQPAARAASRETRYPKVNNTSSSLVAVLVHHARSFLNTCAPRQRSASLQEEARRRITRRHLSFASHPLLARTAVFMNILRNLFAHSKNQHNTTTMVGTVSWCICIYKGVDSVLSSLCAARIRRQHIFLYLALNN